MIDSSSFDDFQRIRQRRSNLVWPESDLAGGGVPSFVGQVTSPASKIGVGDFLMVQSTFVSGDEVEGGAGVFSPFGSSTVPVYLVGPAKALTGDYLICKFVDNRWVAERMSPSGGGSGGGGTIPFCFCTDVPTMLTMKSSDESCNYQMFNNCNLIYQNAPDVFFPLGLTGSIFTSYPQGFPDPVADGAIFYYYLTCQYNQFGITRLYPDSPYGSPFRDAILYSWLVGGTGNTCSPFLLSNGSPLPGNDPTCYPTISG